MNGTFAKIHSTKTFLASETATEASFTPEDFTEEHKDISKAVDLFIKGELQSRAEEIEILDSKLTKKLMRKAGELGFLGIDLPEEYGGAQLDKVSSAIVSERLGYGAGSFSITELNHTGIGTLPVAMFGNEDQKQRYLPRLCSGEFIGAFGLTEPEAGSDALNSSTTAVLSQDGQYYSLNGSKQFITNAAFADIIFTYAKVNGRGFTAFIVEQKWEGVSIGEEERKMGMHGTSTRAYHFDNVKVPATNVLGEVGKGHTVALNALNMGRFKLGAVCTGSAKRAFLEAVRYAKRRKQFGRPICEFGLIKQKIARMAVRLFAAESVVYRTAGLLDARLKELEIRTGEPGIKMAEVLEEYVAECSINKILGSETESYVVDEEVQIFGGYGYIHGNHPELAYRNARINRIWEGTNEINRIAIVSALLKKMDKGLFDLLGTSQSALDEIANFDAVDADDSMNLDAQERLVHMAKKFALIVFGMAYRKYKESLRGEQEVLGILSDMFIEVFAVESAFLRARKSLSNPYLQKAVLQTEITKILCYEGMEKLGFLARRGLEALESGDSLKRHVAIVRKLLLSPQINVIQLERSVADIMIRNGGFLV
jgi:alkylation response protein AidB-like acyl-CoA dehydrogenase